AQRRSWRERVQAQRLEQRGIAGFFDAHPSLRLPMVLAPATAHYSWSKGMKLLGLGRDLLQPIPQHGMRLDADALADMVEACENARQPVLMVVGVLGTTEYGSIDPIDRICAVRDAAVARGFGFGVHVDAAWGGYLAALFRNPDGSLRSREEVAAGFESFPTPAVHAA